MERYLNAGIKEVIQGHPGVGTILEQYGIGCVTCNAGTCLLKDVVQIHKLPPQHEVVLMAQIEKTIYPERNVSVPEAPVSFPSGTPETAQSGPARLKYSPPLKKLVEEHKRIQRLLAFIPAICDQMAQGETDLNLIGDCLRYIRNYADRFHHAKEEEILFAYCKENQDIVRVMIQEHQTGRNYVMAVAAGLESGDHGQVVRGLTGYRELLMQHIEKEDRILYPWIDRNLTIRQVEELTARFAAVNDMYARQLGFDIQREFEMFLHTMEAQKK